MATQALPPYPGLAGTEIPGVKDQVGLGEIERTRVAEYRQMQMEALDKGWLPATIINLHPFSTTVSGVLLHELRIPGISLEDKFWDASLKLRLSNGLEVPYTQHVIAQPEFTVLEAVAGTEYDAVGTIKNRTWWPIELANDVVEQNNRFPQKGGMFAYKGDHLPMMGSGEHVDSVNVFNVPIVCYCNECVQKMADKAYADAIKYYTDQFNEAEEHILSGDPKRAKGIKKMHRWTTRYMRKVGVLQADPIWLKEILSAGTQAPSKCGRCGNQSLAAALFCTNCNNILKPYEAYKKGEIELDTPGAVTALRKLTKEQLIELKLYPEVLPFEEHRAKMAEERGLSDEEKKEKKSKKTT